VAASVELNKAAAMLEAAQNLMVTRHRAYEEREQLLTRCRSWIAELPSHVVLEAVPTPTTNLNGTVTVVIGSLRTRIGTLASEHHRIKVAGPTRDDSRAQIRALVAKLGKKGQPRVISQLGQTTVSGWMGDELYVPTGHAITVEFVAWLMPDAMASRIDEMLEQMPVDPHALPASERASKLAEIEAEIAQLENEEEALVMHAASQGITIERRYDQSPSSILNVRIVGSAAARAA